MTILQSILSVLAGIIGVALTTILSSWIAGWINEVKQKQLEDEAAMAKHIADQSDQNFNNQTSKFPKG